MDTKEKCLTIFIDLAKAFDTVSVPHLLCKLSKLEIRGQPLSLFHNYLCDRRQRVGILDKVSEECTIEYGVPQGSILGPTLFLTYIKDLCRLDMQGGRIFSFADDTALFFCGKSWSEVFSLAQNGFEKVSNWLHTNVLTLNVQKTKYMTFALRTDQRHPSSLSIRAHIPLCIDHHQCECPQLSETDCIKYLGVLIDRTLSFKGHIEALISRLRKLIYLFKCLRNVADRKVIRMVLFALCQSLVDYCITAWGGSAKTFLIQAERAHRAVLKVSAGLPFRSPTFELYKYWDLLTIRQTFILHTIARQHAQITYDPHVVEGKRRKFAVCPVKKRNTTFCQKTFTFLGPHLYNKFNKRLNIYPLNKFHCRKKTITYLKTLNYEETEKILELPK